MSEDIKVKPINDGSLSLKKSPKSSQVWGYTGLLVTLYMINYADKAVFGLVAQPLAEDLGISPSEIGMVGSAFFIAFTVGGFFAGLLTRWISLKWVLAGLCLVWAICQIPMFLILPPLAVIVATRVILGFAEGPSAAIIHTAVYSWHPVERRGFAGSLITAGGSMGKIIFAPIIALTVAAFGWHSAFILLTVLGIIWALIWLATWKVGPYGVDQSRKSKVVESAEDSIRVPWKKILFTRTFIGGAIGVFSMYCIVTMGLTWLPSYFEVGLGFSRVEAGVLFGFPSLAGVAIILVVNFIGDRLLVSGVGTRVLRGVIPSIALLMCGLSWALIPFISNSIVALIVVSVGYGFGMCVFPMFNAGISQILPPKQMAAGLGFFIAIQALGGAASPYLAGVIVDGAAEASTGYANALQVFGIIAAIGAVIALVLVNPERDARRTVGSVKI